MAVRRPHRGRHRRRDRVRQVLDVQRPDRAWSSRRSAYDVRRRRGPPPACGGPTGRQLASAAEDLLDWLGIPPRHRVVRDSMLDSRREDDALRGRGAARPARPRLHRGLPPPRGRPARPAGRPDGLGARPAEVRRRRRPRPLPRAAGHPPRGDAGRAQPRRHGAARPARVDARRHPPAARRRRPRPACPSSRRAPRRARAWTSCARRSPSGWRPRRPSASGSRPTCAALRSGWPRRRGRRRRRSCRRSASPRSRTRSPSRPACRPW